MSCFCTDVPPSYHANRDRGLLRKHNLSCFQYRQTSILSNSKVMTDWSGQSCYQCSKDCCVILALELILHVKGKQIYCALPH